MYCELTKLKTNEILITRTIGHGLEGKKNLSW